MAGDRASIYDSEDEVDLSGFVPKEPTQPKAPVEQVKEISEASRFKSREAPAAAPIASAPVKRAPRRHRTGRTAQFNTRTTPETVAAFYAIADAKGWLVGETVEKALAALQRELKAKKG